MNPRSDAGCDCPPADPADCGLPALVRPRFHPGQVLTDRDLTALDGWVRARLALVRLRSGWGAVCGLGVSADGNAVAVQPGYAVDATGNDVVLTDPLHAKLPRWSDWQADGCGRLDKPAADSPPVVVGPFSFPARDVAVFDVLLCHTTTAEAEVLAPGCRPQPRCESTRTREGGRLEVVSVKVNDKGESIRPSPPTADDPAAKLVKEFTEEFPWLTPPNPTPNDPKPLASPPPQGQKPHVWLAGRLGNGLAGLPGFLPWLQTKEAEDEFRTPWGAARALVWVAAALRAPSPADCPEPRCGCPEAGVPLARVWAVRSGGGFDIRRVSVAPPFRRPFGPDRAAQPLAVRTYLGRPFPEVKRALAAEGVRVEDKRLEPPAEPKHLLSVFEDEKMLNGVFTPDTDSAAVSWTESDGATPTVVAFRAGKATPSFTDPAKPLAVNVAPPDLTEPGGTGAPEFADLPPGVKPLAADATLPLGATVRLQIEVAGLLKSGVTSVRVYTGLTQRLDRVVVPNTLPEKHLLFRVLVPDGVKEKISANWRDVTVLAGDGERTVALTSRISANLQHSSLGNPRVELDGLTVVGVPITAGATVLRLGGAAGPVLNGQVKVVNTHSTQLTGVIQFAAKMQPAAGDWSKVADVKVPAGPASAAVVPAKTDGTPLPTFEHPLAAPDFAVSYRFVGKDELLTAANSEPATAPAGVRDATLAAKITTANLLGVGKAELVLTNTDPAKTLKVTAISARPLLPDPAQPEVKPPLPADLAPNTASPAIELRPDPTVTRWRLVVEYETNGVKEKAVGDFTI